MDRAPNRAPRQANRPANGVLVALLAAAGLSGCGAAQGQPAPSSEQPAYDQASYAPQEADAPGTVLFGTGPLVPYPRTTVPIRLTPARYLPLGSLWADPLTQRIEPVLGDLSRTAVLIGDS